MRTVSTKKLAEIKKAGGAVKMGRAIQKKKAPASPMEKTLVELSCAVKSLKQPDNTAVLTINSAKDIARVLTQAVEKLQSIQKDKQIKQWDVSVIRGKDRLIKKIKMRAVI